MNDKLIEDARMMVDSIGILTQHDGHYKAMIRNLLAALESARNNGQFGLRHHTDAEIHEIIDKCECITIPGGAWKFYPADIAKLMNLAAEKAEARALIAKERDGE